MQEIEVKILEIDPEHIRNILLEKGAQKIFDGHIIADFFINNQGQKIRLRKMNDQNILTYKISKTSHTILHNEEFEVTFGNYEAMKQILEHIGFSRYGDSQKHREAWKLGEIAFDIDTYPSIPSCVEIESHTLENVQKGVEILGYSFDQTVALSEGRLREYYKNKNM